MKSATRFSIGALVAFAAVNTASAQTATQTVTFQVTAINQIAVSGAPSLVINSAAAGSAPTSVTSAGNTWSVTTNQTARQDHGEHPRGDAGRPDAFRQPGRPGRRHQHGPHRPWRHGRQRDHRHHEAQRSGPRAHRTSSTPRPLPVSSRPALES